MSAPPQRTGFRLDSKEQASRVVLLLPALLVTVALSRVGAAEPSDSIVKIYSTQLASNYGTPWKAGTPRSVSGSGLVIPGHRILTNAHVVSDATFIQVRRYGDSERLPARLLHVSDEADLALLTVDAPGFAAGASAISASITPFENSTPSSTASGSRSGWAPGASVSRTPFLPSSVAASAVTLCNWSPVADSSG